MTGSVDLGIGGQTAFPGDHVAYFWETSEQFLAAVEFLAVGLAGGDHCVIFGYDEANARVYSSLESRFDCRSLEERGQLVLLGGDVSGAEMLRTIAADFQQALSGGAKMLRLLGNIGWGRPGWPDQRSILEFEAKVTDAVRDVPAVVVCMYDVRNAGGEIILHGAFETHPITICRNILRENPHFVTPAEFIASM